MREKTGEGPSKLGAISVHKQSVELTAVTSAGEERAHAVLCASGKQVPAVEAAVWW